MIERIFIIMLLTTISWLQQNAMSESVTDRVRFLERKCIELQNRQTYNRKEICKLIGKQSYLEEKIHNLNVLNDSQSSTIDSLRNTCKHLTEIQKADRKNICGKINETNNNVKTNQDTLKKRTILGAIFTLVLLFIVVILTCRLAKRIKSGNTSINGMRKAQDALQVAQIKLQAAQVKMQEESVKLDDKLLELFDRQLANVSKTVDNKPDHSLALKVADEIVRIELNMSRMDSSIKGYKQLAKAVQRIKDNFKANGYEIVDMLGKPYNEGMKVIANFVVDENLEDGKQIITSITKPQINYNGQMIQAAQITVSQNI